MLDQFRSINLYLNNYLFSANSTRYPVLVYLCLLILQGSKGVLLKFNFFLFFFLLPHSVFATGKHIKPVVFLFPRTLNIKNAY